MHSKHHKTHVYHYANSIVVAVSDSLRYGTIMSLKRVGQRSIELLTIYQIFAVNFKGEGQTSGRFSGAHEPELNRFWEEHRAIIGAH